MSSDIFNILDFGRNLDLLFIVFLIHWYESILEGNSSDLKFRQYISILILSGLFTDRLFYDEIMLASGKDILL